MAHAMQQTRSERIGHGKLQAFDHRATEMGNCHAFGP